MDVPLVENLLLRFRITTNKVVERFGTMLGAVGCEGEVMILKVESHAWEIDLGLYTRLTKFLGVADTRPLKDEWGTERATTDNDLLASLVDPGFCLTGCEWLCDVSYVIHKCIETKLQKAYTHFDWYYLYTYGSIAIENDLIGFRAASQMQVLVVSASTVDIGVGGVRSSSGVPI